ncbi:MAG: fumarylacetoacetate hydrolase family protein [Planctomycetes bacterium]|nr:fumarylacetoacetate hydrolase family protein [Planctomycetota bacterium]MCH9727541.1 fumarylacetoacetate hydrolase family protein [Planctomycetota bacterium]MCH9777479.1 fumarylacetoacetate hydrolase family protein [Planctomycetota bacterium]MCH9791766.1 fumarylacetoacetate hydrolase family protein [Planctomycetota bacterium]
MKLAKVLLSNGERHIAIVEENTVQLLDLSQVDSCHRMSDILYAPDPVGLSKFLVDTELPPVPFNQLEFLAPLDQQEVWAAGVTYKRSQVARMEESEAAASHYDQVYTADRPELFFKATPNRVCGPNQPVRVRYDSQWSVPEPELALVVSPDLRLVGYTVGNDMSARDIEGENPLYLPQAKFYKQCCGLGPCILLHQEPLPREATKIKLVIERSGEEVFQGETSIGEMARDLEDLISWLGIENDFPSGAILLTGTGIVPPDEFSLEDRDIVSIDISGIGTLINPIVKDAAP